MGVALLDSLKGLGKRIHWVRLLNGHLKSIRLKREYDKSVSYYASFASADNLSSGLTEKSLVKLQRLAPGRQPRIFFLGTDELQDRSGILQALDRIGELTYFTRSDGSYGQNCPGSEYERRVANSDRLLKLFEEMSGAGRTPDLLLAQTWAGYINPKVLERIRNSYGTTIVNIAMDDRHQYWGRKVNGEWWGTYGLIPHLDLTLTAAPECVEWYEKEGCPAIYFPEASDPEIFHPMKHLPKIHDVSFVGGRYGIREKIVSAIRHAGVQVTAGWDSGRLDAKAVPRLFAQSKIVLGIGTVGYCDDFYALKMRDFDGPMSGSFYLTHDNPDLYSLYEVGKEIETYRSMQDCVEKVEAYLAEGERRERIAAAGRERAARDHTWDRRFSVLFDILTSGANSSSRLSSIS
jgi:hypothetical protein